MRFRERAAASRAAVFTGMLVAALLLAARPAVAFFEPPVPEVLDAQPVLPLSVEPRIGDGLDAGRGHEGIDLFAPAGTPLAAVDDAVVIETGNSGGRGNYVSIFDPERDRTYNYLHMLAPALVRPGEHVDTGEKLGELGCTGSCWGNHLHFELRSGRGADGPVLDPLPFIRGLDPAAPRRLPAALAPG